MSVSPHVTIGKQSPVDVENTCLEPVTSALSRLVMAEMQDFSNAVQGSWAFQENFQCRPVLFSLHEKWCGGNINQQVRILFLNWEMNIFLVISQLKLYVDIVQFFFFHYCYNLIVGLTFTLWEKSNQTKTKTPHQPFSSGIQKKIC